MNNAGIAFIGGGNMAASLIAGLIADGHAPRGLWVAEPDAVRREGLRERFGVQVVADNRDAIAHAETLVLCVKPQLAPGVCREIGDLAAGLGLLVISIMAGVPESGIQRWLGAPLPVVRAMPNTPAMVQTGAIALHASPQVTEEGRNRAETILRAAGLVRWVEEEAQIDAVTALSGSGPAYFFLFMEAMEEAGAALGLDAETARLLTIQTALGAARMAVESESEPARLRAQVTSPGGTTERALAVFEEAGLRGVVARALSAARDRAAEISRTLSEQP
ncbi:MAG: pyrroline-5-carboxylate reductase [Chromatiaceae bacterium]|jgi:pyrroline-5-carboxylate reductase